MIPALRPPSLTISLALVLVLAAFDESRQAGLASRTGSVLDVALDFSGGVVFLGITLVVHSFLRLPLWARIIEPRS